MSKDKQSMVVEPDNDQGKIGKSVKSLFIAAVIIIVFSLVSVYGLYQLAKYFSESVPWSVGQKLSGKTLPQDIPLYSGAVLAESTANGSRLTFVYMLPLGAQTTARKFYETEMIKNDWSKLASNENLLEFFKKEGKRRALIRINYQNGKASLDIEIIGPGDNK